MAQVDTSDPNWWKKARAKCWCFTLNNWTQEERDALWDNGTDIRFLCIGEEHAPTTGTPHLQGYVQFYRQLYGTTVKRVAGLKRAHLEPARSTLEKNRKYCSKEGNHTERGVPLTVGYRTDLEDVRDMIAKDATEVDVADHMFSQWVYHRKAFQRFAEMHGKRKYKWVQKNVMRLDMELVFYYGPSGVGKSFRAMEEHPDAFIRFNDGTIWWDDYDGETTIIMEEFNCWYPYKQLLKLCDKLPYKLPRRGQPNCQCLATTIVFTSIEHPNMWYKGVDDTSEWQRRVRQMGTAIRMTDPHPDTI